MTNNTPTSSARIAIVGASGYTGAELIDLLLAHPRAAPVALFGSARQEHNPTLDEVHPRFIGRTDLVVSPASTAAILAAKPDAVMLATPHEAAVPLAAELLARNIPVIDLSAAFRLTDPAAYPAHYNFTHAQPALLATAVYGLPELPNTRDALKAANLVACPGCYPTASILGLAPAVRAGLIAPGTRPIIDATSGISGAGRAANQANLFCEVSQRAYNVFAHRHQPEINEHAGIDTIFTPHVGPYDRGILATIHLDLVPGTTSDDLRAAYAAAYDAPTNNEPFVHLRAPGTWPAINDVARTNSAHIALAVDEAHNHAIVVVAIDNLLKGASGQALQCMNLRLGFNETDGLTP